VRKVPRTLQDFLPHGLSKLSQPLRALAVVPQQPAPAVHNSTALASPTLSSSDSIDTANQIYTTSSANGFGLFRSYLVVPSRDPEAELGLEDVIDAPTFAATLPKNPKPWWSIFGRTVT
jgi:hypothetical protein